MHKDPVPAQCSEATTLYQRIDAVIELIPDDFIHKDVLIHALRGRQRSILFTAPTAMDGRWQEVASTLGSWLPNSDQPNWVEEISKIMSAPC